jgi:RTX calcium-binding nonapeptide repeat (4 copies)
MSFIRRRQADSLETELRRNRPEPREDFVRALEARISADAPARRRGARARFGLAGAMTAAMLVVVGAFGGISYAAGSVTHAAHQLAAVLTFAPHNVGSVSAAADQYNKVTLCHNGHEITVAQSAVAAHLAQGDTLGKCKAFAPPVSLTPSGTLDLSRSLKNSIILALKGDNTIKTNNRDNKITTGTGNDIITTGTGTNLVKTGTGNDTIKSKGKDTIFAGKGDDTINVRNGKPNFVNCGSGKDIVIADPANVDFIAKNCEIVRRGKFVPSA